MSKLLKAQQTSLTQQAFRVHVKPVRSMYEEPEIDLVELERSHREKFAEAETIRVQAQAEAQRLISEAQAMASLLLEQERERVQQVLQAEVDEAKRAGYEDGLMRGRQEAEAEYASRLKDVQQLHRSAIEERHRYLAASESVIVDMACAVARKIIRQETTLGREWVLDVVRQALEEVHDAQKIEVRVHPDDYERVNQSRHALRQEVPGQSELLVLPDRGVEVGGCVVNTSFGNVDARIDTQLEEVRKALQEVAARFES